MRKLKSIVDDLEAVVRRPYYPVRPPWRIVSDLDGLQLDFLDAIHGTSSFEGLRRRASEAHFGGTRLLVAALADIIKANGQAVRGLIRRGLALPMGQQTNFLRKRIGICSSCL